MHYILLLGYPRWGCIPIYWGTSRYGDAFMNTGVHRYMVMHSRLRAYPSIWGCIPICWGNPVYGNTFPYTGASEWECSPMFVLIMVIEMKIMIVIDMMMIMTIDTLV